MKMGLRWMHSTCYSRPLLSPLEVATVLEEALRAGRGLALVRLGDGEALTLAHELVITTTEAQERGPFLPYAGVRLPDPGVRDRLARAVRAADVLGVTTGSSENYAPLLQASLVAHGIDLTSRLVTDACINYSLHSEGHLARLLLDLHPQPRVLVVGNLGARLASALAAQGAVISGAVHPVNGCQDTDRVLKAIASIDFDIGLVAAGITAVIICSEIAQAMRKVMIDFGHLADQLVTGNKVLRPK